MSIQNRIAHKLGIKQTNVSAVIELLDDGNTIPFIARYRKEVSGGSGPEELRSIRDELQRMRALEARRSEILNAINKQKSLTPELGVRIRSAATRTELEDLYLPFKQKRTSRAQVAIRQGLKPLAEIIHSQTILHRTVETAAQEFINDEITTLEKALAGARDILIEEIATDAEVRGSLRNEVSRQGRISVVVKDTEKDPGGVFQDYYAFERKLKSLDAYQIMAINRGAEMGILRVRIVKDDIGENKYLSRKYPVNKHSGFSEQLQIAKESAIKDRVFPAVERDIRKTITRAAEERAIEIFRKNLSALLTQPPVEGHIVLGIDPGFRTGCKAAVIDTSGSVLDTATIYPHAPQKNDDAARRTLSKLVVEYGVSLIAIGNGTASRETEQLVSQLIAKMPEVHYLIVSEAGASVYSASPLAANELPDMDVSMRGAVSIARRLIDPLAEYVKIEPRSLGIGLYQHDIDQSALTQALKDSIEYVVNRVGVEVNTASPALLQHVAGIGPKLAQSIVSYRAVHGPYKRRQELMQVKGFGKKAFEQSAGFLRIRNGTQPLDATAIHPESYRIAARLLKIAHVNMADPAQTRAMVLETLLLDRDVAELAQHLDTGVPTLKDILEQIIRPGRDPRKELPGPVFRRDVLKMEDLQIGMLMRGTVRNVVDFGAFVDIGVKRDGLLHRSLIPRGTQLSIGNVIEVEIKSVDLDRLRIGLSWPG